MVVTAHLSGEWFQLHPSTQRQIIYKWRTHHCNSVQKWTPIKTFTKKHQKNNSSGKQQPTHNLQRGCSLAATTIRWKVNIYDIHGRVSRIKPLLSRKNKVACLNFGREHLDKPDAFWKSKIYLATITGDMFGEKSTLHIKKKTPPESEALWWKYKSLGLLFCLQTPGQLQGTMNFQVINKFLTRISCHESMSWSWNGNELPRKGSVKVQTSSP